MLRSKTWSLWTTVVAVLASVLLGVSAAVAAEYQPSWFGWAEVRAGSPDQNYAGSPQPGTIQVWQDGANVCAQADYFFWDSDQVKRDTDPKLDWTHDDGEADYQNYGSDVPNEGVDVWDDNGSPFSREEVELKIIEANINVGHTYRYFNVGWKRVKGSGKPNLSYEWGPIWDRWHDWLEGQSYATSLHFPLLVRRALGNEGTNGARFDRQVLNGLATLRAVKHQDGRVRGRVRWDVADPKMRDAHTVASRIAAQQLIASGTRAVPVTITFRRALSEHDVVAIANQTGLRIKHAYAGGVDAAGTRFSAGAVMDNGGRFQAGKLSEILAEGGARYVGITGLEGDISAAQSGLGTLLAEPRVGAVDVSAAEARHILAKAYGVPVESVTVAIPSPHWFVALD